MGAMATAKPSKPTGEDAERAAYLERTLGGAIPDPEDDTPRGKFARGEISYEELQAFYRDDTGAEHVEPTASA
jgi:hypothetical protein